MKRLTLDETWVAKLIKKVKSIDQVTKWSIIVCLLRVFMACIYISVFVGLIRYVSENGIQSICETIWYGSKP